jgi:hypothetical protein
LASVETGIFVLRVPVITAFKARITGEDINTTHPIATLGVNTGI